MKNAWRKFAKLAIVAALLVAVATPGIAGGGIYLSGFIYCAGACCSDNLNAGCDCQGAVPGWQYGTIYCNINET
jgi:hypothetical protein